MAKGRILIIDDEAVNLKLLGEILRDKWELSFAKSGEEALKRIETAPPDLILLDIMMPEMDGYQLAQKLQENAFYKRIPLIFVTAMHDEMDELRGFELGAVDFIAKPVNPVIVKARVTTHYNLAKAQKQLANTNIVLDQKVEQRTQALQELQKELIHRLVRASEYRDSETANHINRISGYVEVIARKYGLRPPECELLKTASLMHDIGKVGVADSILLKPGPLSDEEFAEMRGHVKIGGEILTDSRYDLIQIGQNIAVYHHERWDGTGYPDRLRETKIPLEARITSVADVFDALISKRPYKNSWDWDEAVQYIQEGSNSQFDPTVVRAFMAALPEIQEIYSSYRD